MKGFWKKFIKADPTEVSQATILATAITIIISALAIPAAILGMAGFYHHVWTLKKGLDGSAAQVIIALIGGGGVGCGLGYGIARLGQKPPAKIAKAPEV